MKYLVKKGDILYEAPLLNDFKSCLIVYIKSQIVFITSCKIVNEKNLETVNKDIEKELDKIIELTDSGNKYYNKYCDEFIIKKVMPIVKSIGNANRAKQNLLDIITRKENNILILQNFINKIKSCTNYETIIDAINDEHILDSIDMSDFELIEAKSQNDFIRDVVPKKHNCFKTPVVTKFLDDEDPEFGWDQ